jgi:hypothetical protein
MPASSANAANSFPPRLGLWLQAYGAFPDPVTRHPAGVVPQGTGILSAPDSRPLAVLPFPAPAVSASFAFLAVPLGIPASA